MATGTMNDFETCVTCDKEIYTNERPRRFKYDRETKEYTCAYCATKKKKKCDYCELYKSDVTTSPYEGDEHFEICRDCWNIANYDLQTKESIDIGGYGEISYFGRGEDE